MAHEALVAQSEAAYGRGSKYLTQTDGFNVVSEDHEVTFSVLLNDTEHVAKFTGSVNKTPEFAMKFIAGNMAALRAAHMTYSKSTEYVANFPDNSHVIKEISEYPDLGEMTMYKYFRRFPTEDGTVTLVGTVAELPEYPKGHSWLNFLIVKVEAHEGGSRFTIVNSPETTIQLPEEKKRAIAAEIKKFFVGVVTDVRNAA
ncbi:hypothetical protein SteCoe_2997 [Stentor coeruleus]|uniref:START domain-containing protein n=1 Tax=Stentor coeruleus TaxID=5963 RepID=A0A1R2CY90_9CILI|nr:hypothetical protein SteCoe_2997 [Stentor coeruleus]